MCYSEGTLQAFLDGELGESERRSVEDHLRSCASCRQLLAKLSEDQRLVDGAVGTFLAEPHLTDASAHNEWNRLQERLRPLKKETWYEVARRSRFAVAGMAAVLTLAVGLSFGSVRVAAGRFLSIFRVDRFQAITVTPEDLSRVQEMVRKGVGSVRLGALGEVEMSTSGREGLVSLDQARDAVDFGLRFPSRLPGGLELQGLTGTPNVNLELTLGVQQANQLIKSLGGTKMLPEELDGETFSLRVSASIDAQYGGMGTLHFLQARSPELNMPGNASAGAVREALLAMPFLPENVKRQLAAVDDWQHTFLVPDVRGSTQDVTVDGVSGIYVTVPEEYQEDEDDEVNALVWEKNGVVYAVVGEFDLEQGLAIGNSLK